MLRSQGRQGDKGEDAGGGDLVDAGQVGERSGGKTPEESIYEAAVLRFRPIMMTTTAALFGGGRWTDRVAGFDAVHDPRHLPLHDRFSAVTARDLGGKKGKPSQRPPAETASRSAA